MVLEAVKLASVTASVLLHLSNCQTCFCTSASDKAKLFSKNFSKNFNIDDSHISLPVFPSRTNLKLYNISITPKMVKKFITNLNSSKGSGPDFIPVVVLKNCKSELSCILTELFNMYL